MSIRRMGYGIVAMGMVAATGALAADPASVQAPIHGAAVMGDKGRSAPDGWAQAPVTRDNSASGGAQGAKPVTATTPSSIPAGPAPTLPPGQDPATPATPHSMAPGK